MDPRRLRLPHRRVPHHDGHARGPDRPTEAAAHRQRRIRGGLGRRGVLDHAGAAQVARAALGIAGATLAPSTLALIGGMFRDEQQRGFAIGVWLVCFMGGAVIGPVVGGWVLEHWWWGGAFLLAVPVMVLLLALGPVLLPEQRDPARGRLDLVSVALSLGAILPLFAGIKELAAHGVAVVPAALVVAGIAVGIVFIRRQLRLEHPLLDLALF
ncbi:MAG TPA: MFS transporter, partial [Microlunatus sp.]|nr:MFS transporter [Microlunatus sp.]